MDKYRHTDEVYSVSTKQCYISFFSPPNQIWLASIFTMGRLTLSLDSWLVLETLLDIDRHRLVHPVDLPPAVGGHGQGRVSDWPQNNDDADLSSLSYLLRVEELRHSLPQVLDLRAQCVLLLGQRRRLRQVHLGRGSTSRPLVEPDPGSPRGPHRHDAPPARQQSFEPVMSLLPWTVKPTWTYIFREFFVAKWHAGSLNAFSISPHFPWLTWQPWYVVALKVQTLTPLTQTVS